MARGKSDTRGRQIPEDNRTHIDRINDWEGSDSYAGEGVTDRFAEHPGPANPGEMLPYKLLTKATDRHGLLRKAGQHVHLYAHEVAAHHERLPDVDYSAHGVMKRAEELVEEVKEAHPKEFAKEEQKVKAESEKDDC